jgi:hypothetical protein
MGVLIVDDRFLLKFIPARWKSRIERQLALSPPRDGMDSVRPVGGLHGQRRHFGALKIASAAVILTWIFYATTVEMMLIVVPRLQLPMAPVTMLEPFRIANQYGLFAVMTRARYEIEFQGTNDGANWTPYPFRYKPQALNEAPGIYAPYQPRLDWNLWFASLGHWRNNLFVLRTQLRLLENNRDVLDLLAGNPFAHAPPKQVRAVLWQYRFTTMAEKRATGNWWRREFIGIYSPTLEGQPDGKIGIVEMPAEATPQP